MVVVAPGGYGKTTAIRDFVESAPGAIYIAVPNSATTLERFIRVFARECEQRFPEMAAPPVDRVLEDPDQHVEIYLAWAAVHLANATCTIAIDDLHHTDADPAVGAFITRLVESSKDRISWLLGSRTTSNLPLTRWQAYGFIDAPITSTDLRLTTEEALRLSDELKSTAGPEQVTRWADQTSGFPLALTYAIRASSRPGNDADVMDQTRRITFQFLSEELWQSLRAEERYLLEIASFLPAALIRDYERGGIDNAIAIATRLAESISFLHLAADGTFFLHDLFRDFVKEQIARSGAGHRRTRYNLAANFLLDAGRFEDAFDLLLDMGDAEKLAAAIERFDYQSADVSISRRLIDGIGAVPLHKLGPASLSIQCDYWGWAGEVPKCLSCAEEILARDNSRSHHLLSAVRAIARMIQFKELEQRTVWLSKIEALTARIDVSSDRARALAYLTSILSQYSWAKPRIPELLLEIRRYGEFEAGVHLEIQIALIPALLLIGDASGALAASREAVRTAQALGDLREVARSMNSLGIVLFDRKDPEVETIFEPLRQAVEKTGSWRFSQASHWYPSLYYLLQGDAAAADRVAHLQESALVASSERERFANTRRLTKHLRFLNGAQYAQIIRDCPSFAESTSSEFAYDATVIGCVAYALARQTTEASRTLDRARLLRESGDSRLSMADSLSLEIIALAAIGHRLRAKRLMIQYPEPWRNQASLHAALTIFCDGPPYVGLQDALAACTGKPFIGLPALLMSRVMESEVPATDDIRLSTAESDILRLLQLGKSNKEIAILRNRSAATIKVQVASLCRKLQVENRMSAVAIGRERGLI